MHLVLLLAGAAGALVSPHAPLRSSPASPIAPAARLRASRVLVAAADGDDGASSFSEAFANLAKSAQPKKPGEGAPKKPDVQGLSVRLGGTTRDGSLGDLRAAAQLWPILRDPRNWEAEEIGLLGVIAFTAAAFFYGYSTYVAPPPPQASGPSKAAIVRQQRLDACAGDAACEQTAMADTEAALEKERQLEACLDYAYGASEKRICQFKAATGGF